MGPERIMLLHLMMMSWNCVCFCLFLATADLLVCRPKLWQLQNYFAGLTACAAHCGRKHMWAWAVVATGCLALCWRLSAGSQLFFLLVSVIGCGRSGREICSNVLCTCEQWARAVATLLSARGLFNVLPKCSHLECVCVDNHAAHEFDMMRQNKRFSNRAIAST